jgi:hypothetical protein
MEDCTSWSIWIDYCRWSQIENFNPDKTFPQMHNSSMASKFCSSRNKGVGGNLNIKIYIAMD